MNENEDIRGREVAKLLVQAHKDVNKVLRRDDSLDEAAALKMVENALLADIPEVLPDDLKFEHPTSLYPMWRVVDIIIVVAFVLISLVVIAAFVCLIVCLVRRKK